MSESTDLITTAAPLARPLVAPLDSLLTAWLDAKSKRTGSAKTRRAYADTVASFRVTLHPLGLDLDSDVRAVALAAGSWASRREADSHHAGDVSAATFNQRLAVLSSFYAYVIKQGLYEGINPIARVERRPVEAYQGAQPMDAATVKRRLAAIDQVTPEGQRDYALLSVALTTGRRAAELAGLRWRDVQLVGTVATLTFAAKGGKVMRDTLTPAVGRVLFAWLHTHYGALMGALAPDAAIWVNLSHNARADHEPLSVWGVADMCQRRIGTRKVHSLRHTFARTMETSGAKVSDIQKRLGHSSLQTTTRYLDALKAADNPYAAALADVFGIG